MPQYKEKLDAPYNPKRQAAESRMSYYMAMYTKKILVIAVVCGLYTLLLVPMKNSEVLVDAYENTYRPFGWEGVLSIAVPGWVIISFIMWKLCRFIGEPQ